MFEESRDSSERPNLGVRYPDDHLRLPWLGKLYRRIWYGGQLLPTRCSSIHSRDFRSACQDHYWPGLEAHSGAAQKHEIKQVYVQDPAFNSLDEDFLRGLGYEIISSPEGFEKIDETTFLFAPHLEWPIYLAALREACPSLCVGNDVREYLDSPSGSASDEAKAVFQKLTERCSTRAMPDFDRSMWCMSTVIYWMRPRSESDGIGNP